tara:strand:+ start:21499 stop:23181 length:1683 start_codon:yes stop_codon:yes gene_type:complete
MAVTQSQKVDFLWKKLGYGRTKTDTNANKKAFNESIASPLLMRGDKIWQQSGDIPSSIPGSSTSIITVYPTSTPVECTADITASTNRTWKTNSIDWIPPELGSTYLVKVYVHTSGDAAGASGGDVLLAAGSGNDDEWFFDYQSGVLHFVGENLPNGVDFTGKSVYISGARYAGAFGLGGVASGNFSDIVNFTDTTDNTLGDSNTGGAQFDGGVGIDKNLTVGGSLHVQGHSNFVGVVTFRGGTINLGDGNTDNVSFGGEIVSNFVPSDDATYDLGTGAKQWRNLSLSGIVTSAAVVTDVLTLNGVGITSITDEDDMASDSDTAVPTQQSVKAYVDAQLTAQDLDFQADSGGALSVDLDSESLLIAGTPNQIDTVGAGQSVTVSLPSNVDITTSLAVPTVRSESIQHTSGNNAATIDSLGDITAARNLTVTGDLFVNGSTTQVNTNSISVEDRTIELGRVGGAAPTGTTTWDLGVLFNYYDGSAKKSAVAWEAGVGRLVFAGDVADSGGSSSAHPQITVNEYAAIEVGALWVNDCAGQSQVIACANGQRTLENITIDGGSF